jgi:DNA-binding NarL/FixJ family response regulator
MSVIRVMLVDDHRIFREGLRTLLTLAPDVEVVAEASDGHEGMRLACVVKPDVILMDLKMPQVDGVTATRRLRALLPSCRVVALTTFEDDDLIFEVLRAGAVGYLLKDASSERLLDAVRSAAKGDTFLQPSVATKVVAELSRLAERAPAQVAMANPLSERELEVLRLLARGAANKEIAATLSLAEGTVKNHVTNVLAKLEVSDRTSAALKARALGFV